VIDVTEIVLNFRKVLVAIAKGLSSIGLYKGSDEWEELTENAFNILISNYIAEKFSCSITQVYEVWDRRSFKDEVVVEVCPGAFLLIGVRSESSGSKYHYNEIANSNVLIRFSFVEFGNPLSDERDIDGLKYALGIDESGRIISAKIEDCKFFISN